MNEKGNTIQVKKDLRLTNVQRKRYKFSAEYFMQGAGRKFYNSLSVNTQKLFDKFDLTLPKRQSNLQQNTKKVSDKVAVIAGLAIAAVPVIEKINKKLDDFSLQPIVDVVNGALENAKKIVSKIDFTRFEKIGQKIVIKDNLKNNFLTIRNSMSTLFGDKKAMALYGDLFTEQQKKHGLFGQIGRAAMWTMVSRCFSYFGLDIILNLLGIPNYRNHLIEGIYNEMNPKHRKTAKEMQQLVQGANTFNGGSVVRMIQSSRSWTTDVINSEAWDTAKTGIVIIGAAVGAAKGFASGAVAGAAAGGIGAIPGAIIGTLVGAGIGAGTVYGAIQGIEIVNQVVIERGIMTSMLDENSVELQKEIIEKQNQFRYKLLQETKKKFIALRTNQGDVSLKEIIRGINKLKFVKFYGKGWEEQSSLISEHKMINGLNGHQIFEVIPKSEKQIKNVGDAITRNNCIKINDTVKMIDQLLAESYREFSHNTQVEEHHTYGAYIYRAWKQLMTGVKVSGKISDKTLHKLAAFLPYVARITTAINLKRKIGVTGVFSQFDRNKQDEQIARKIDQQIEKRSTPIDRNYENFDKGLISSKTYFQKAIPQFLAKVKRIVGSFGLVEDFDADERINLERTWKERLDKTISSFLGKIDMRYWDVGVRKLNEEIQKTIFGGANVLLYSNKGISLNLRKQFGKDQITKHINTNRKAEEIIYQGFKLNEEEGQITLYKDVKEDVAKSVIDGNLSKTWEGREDLGKFHEWSGKKYKITSVKCLGTKKDTFYITFNGRTQERTYSSKHYEIKGVEILGVSQFRVTETVKEIEPGELGIERRVEEQVFDEDGERVVIKNKDGKEKGIVAKTKIKIQKHQTKTVGDKLVEDKIPVEQRIAQVKNRISALRKQIYDLRSERNYMLKKLGRLL